MMDNSIGFYKTFECFYLVDDEDVSSIIAKVRTKELYRYFEKRFGWSKPRISYLLLRGLPFDYYGVRVQAIKDE